MKPSTTIQLSRFLFFVLLTLCFYSTSFGQAKPELIYFKFDNVMGTTVPNDADPVTAVSTNGTLNGATVGGTGQFNTALVGNGGATASNSLNANWALNYSGPWTISLWMENITNTAVNNYIFGGSGGITFRAFTGSSLVAGAGNIMLRGTGITDVKVLNVFNATGSPVVVHFVYDNVAGEIRSYVNGVPDIVVAQSTTLTLTGTDFRVGGQAASTGIPNGAKIDEFRMYNRALSAAEIAGTWNTELNACSPPPNISYTALAPTTATIQWTPAPGALTTGYEWAVTTTNTPPAAGTPVGPNVNSANVGGLMPNTWHYYYVRTMCNGAPQTESDWVLDSFKTPRPCDPPTNLTIADITVKSGMFSWTSAEFADAYEYAFSTNPIPPTFGAKIADTFVNGPGLKGGRNYYAHVRSVCTDYPYSVWESLQFYVLAPAGVDEVNDDGFKMVLYPNPVHDKAIIEVTKASGNAVAVLTDITGKVIQKYYITGNKISLDMAGLTSGIYIVNYQDDEHSYKLKVIKQ